MTLYQIFKFILQNPKIGLEIFSSYFESKQDLKDKPNLVDYDQFKKTFQEILSNFFQNENILETSSFEKLIDHQKKICRKTFR